MSIQATRKSNFLEIDSLERSINKRLLQFIWIYMHLYAYVGINKDSYLWSYANWQNILNFKVDRFFNW